MMIRFAGSAAEVFAKFREIEARMVEIEQKSVPNLCSNRVPPAREKPSCRSSDPFQGSLSRLPSAMQRES